MLPGLVFEHMTGQIVLMQALHDQHDRAVQLVVKSAVERVVVPVVDHFALALRLGVQRLDRVVDDDRVGAAPGQDAADRGCQPVSLASGDQLLQGWFCRRQPGLGKDPPIERAHHQGARVARQLVRKFLGVADADDRGRGILP